MKKRSHLYLQDLTSGAIVSITQGSLNLEPQILVLIKNYLVYILQSICEYHLRE